MMRFLMATAIFPLLFLGDSVAFSQLTAAKYAGEFLSLGAGARSLGMGDAYVAVSTNVTSGYWNPAGLAHLDYPEFMLMHSSQFTNTVNYDYGSFGIPVGAKGSFGFSIFRVGVDNIKRTALPDPTAAIGDTIIIDGQAVRNTPYVQTLFGSTDYAFFLTYAKQPSEGFSFGGNVKILHRGLGENSAWGIGFDIGVLFNPVADLRVGVNLQDITSTLVAWDTGRRELITPAMRAGVTYPLAISALGGTFQPALDMLVRFENRREFSDINIGRASMDFRIGAEYRYRDVVAVRLGASEIGKMLRQNPDWHFSAGAGIRLPKLHLDYAFLGHKDLGNSHRISARLTLEEPKFRRKE